jgi:hypothetical protein
VKRGKWGREAQEVPEDRWGHQVWRGREDDLAGMERGDCLGQLDPRVSLDFKDFLGSLDRKETVGTKEMLDLKEMKGQGV